MTAQGGVFTAADSRVEELERDLEEERQLRDRLTSILTRTANALKGKPPDLVWHDWSDLPEVATTLKAEVSKLRFEAEKRGCFACPGKDEEIRRLQERLYFATLRGER